MSDLVRLNRLEKERLDSFPDALQRDFGIATRQGEIVSALVYATSIGQVAGILSVYNRYTAARKAGNVPAWLEPPAL